VKFDKPSFPRRVFGIVKPWLEDLAMRQQVRHNASMSLYDFKVRTIDGEEVSLGMYRDKVLLIVNTASHCGFTPQFAGLEELYQRFASLGFSVLGFPCNQFGGQDPGTDAEIGQFCTREYGVTFPMFSKIEVNGDDAHPLFQYLKAQVPGVLGTTAIKWNFSKFLVDRNGTVVERFAPNATPQEIAKSVEPLLT
jgi:glutathione peroxidase